MFLANLHSATYVQQDQAHSLRLCGHFEQVNFWETLSKGNTILDIIREFFFNSRCCPMGHVRNSHARRLTQDFLCWVKNLSINPRRLVLCSFIGGVSLETNRSWFIIFLLVAKAIIEVAALEFFSTFCLTNSFVISIDS